MKKSMSVVFLSGFYVDEYFGCIIKSAQLCCPSPLHGEGWMYKSIFPYIEREREFLYNLLNEIRLL